MHPPSIPQMYGDPLAPGAVAGSHVVLESVYRGQFFSVYRARHQSTDQLAALKVLHLALVDSHDVVARFQNQAEALEQLHHPNIVRVMEFSELHDGRPYMAMEWLDGRNLNDELVARGPLPARHVLAVMTEVCDALILAHKRGVIHRAIKGENIIAVPEADWFTVKLIDFGITGALASIHPVAVADGWSAVAPRHRALEQLLGPEQDPRTDIFALGLLLQQLVTGRLVASESCADVAETVLHAGQEGADARDWPVFGDVVENALTQRHGSVSEFLAALRVAVEAVSGHPSLGASSAAAMHVNSEPPRRSYGVETYLPTIDASALRSKRPAAHDRRGTDQDWMDTIHSPGPCPGIPTISADRAGQPHGAVLPSPGDRIHQYEIIRELDRGGMGAVFLARDIELARRVAIKFLLSDDDDTAQQLLMEARATARCSHENIVIIHEVGEHCGTPFMVLEYLKGKSLDQLVRGQKLTVERALELMIPVVRALACAHQYNIVHRDLKPENVFVTRSGVVKVFDFGLAKPMLQRAGGSPAAAESLDAMVLPDEFRSTTNGKLKGTLPYMSPEQINRHEVDHRADLWAAGIMLYEMLTGEHPLEPVSWTKVIEVGNLNLPMPGLNGAELGELGPLIERCLTKSAADRIASATELLAELEALVPDPYRCELGADKNPFAGLAAFQESGADRFFGRAREIASVTGRVRSQPLLTLAGPSGVGKSSLIRAGVLPALKRSGEGWEALVIRPGRSPMVALASLLAQNGASSSDLEALAGRLRKKPGYLGTELRARATGRSRRIAIFVDQFEELYTLSTEADEADAFVTCLAGAADDATSPLRVVLAVRSDFLHRIFDHRQFAPEVTRALIFLPSMGRKGLREALIRPVEAAGYRFESAQLVERMLDDVAATPGALPVLQFTASTLWESRDREHKVLTAHSYDQIGGVTGTLASYADTVLASLTPLDLTRARAIVESLVTPERTRGIATMPELCQQLLGDPGDIERVVQHLAGARLVTIETPGLGAVATVELSHESLIDGWPTLRRWLAQNQEDAEFLARLRTAADQWVSTGCAEGMLWRGETTREALRWRKRYRGQLSRAQIRFLDATSILADRARRQRRNAITAIVSGLALVAVFMAALAWQQKQAARRAENEAARARDATRMAAARQWQSDPTTVLAMLREVEQHDPPPGWFTLAPRALHSHVARIVLSHPEQVTHAAFSRDDRRIVSASADSIVRVWQANGTDEPLALEGHKDTVLFVAFGPDGERIASASRDKTIRVWQADGQRQPVILRGHEGEVQSAAFSPDGQRIVSASDDRTVRVWRADGLGQPLVFRGHQHGVSSAVFSPDGRHIVSGSVDKTIRIWRADGQQQPLVLRGHDRGVYSVAYSSDGQHIVSTSDDKTIRVWRADGSGEPLILRGHDDAVWSGAFSPDNKWIVSASADRTIRLWRADGIGDARVIPGHNENVRSVAFNSSGTNIVSGSADKTVRVWSVSGTDEPRSLRGHKGIVWSVAFSPDGQHIVSGSADKTVRVWRADGQRQPRVLEGHDDTVWSVAFSPDSNYIVSGSADKTVRVWRVDGQGQPRVFDGHDDTVNSVAFSPGGDYIVSGSADQTLRIWRADGLERPLVLRGHEHGVLSVAFSPDGQHIVSSSKDQTVRVWRTDGTGRPRVLRGHGRWVFAASFSPDGAHIVSASFDETVRVWRADGTGQPRVLRGHQGGVYRASFSPDGQSIVSGSADKTMRIWRADGTGEPLILRGHSRLVWTASFSPDGRRIVSAAEDNVIRVWSDLEPIAPDSPRLWSATAYCMPIELRQRLLGVGEEIARANRQRCLDRVKQAR
ncbi:MAG: protein kinase [Proteobacteria bacterium]|nr:protein kinase [Pseudomonadota bacterium]